jgi:NADPH:quinone reductase-like Zn-dependent oxidoreductase
VYGTFFQSWISGPVSRERTAAPLGSPLDGMLTEIRVLNAEGLAHIPAHLTYDEAATLPCAAVTAWNALVVAGQVKAGDTVLVQGTGGVSIFALQFAKLHGARVIVTSSSDEKLAAAKSMGADGAVNYKSTPDWDKAARQWSDGLGVDHVIEVGGAGTFGKSLRAARQGGHIAAIGVLSGGSSEMNLFPLLMQSLRVSGIFVGSRDMAEAMNRAIAGAGMRPAIDRVFEFGQAVDALRHLADGAHFGKIVIRV